jgi:hypothetical protein
MIRAKRDLNHFYLHGGETPGSSGCIDTGGGMFGDDVTKLLIRDLQADPDKQVPLVVQ